jgi:hypothetical protein
MKYMKKVNLIDLNDEWIQVEEFNTYYNNTEELCVLVSFSLFSLFSRTILYTRRSARANKTI